MEFLTTLCALYSFINALYIELLRKRNFFFRGGKAKVGVLGEESRCFGGGKSVFWGWGDKLVFGVRGNPRAPPPSLCFSVVFVLFMVGCGGFCLDIREYIKVLYYGSTNRLYTLLYHYKS